MSARIMPRNGDYPTPDTDGQKVKGEPERRGQQEPAPGIQDFTSDSDDDLGNADEGGAP